MDDSQLTMNVATGTGASFVTQYPQYVIIAASDDIADLQAGETVLITARNVDEYTIERSSPIAHAAGEYVYGNVLAEDFTHIIDVIKDLLILIRMSYGNLDGGVISTEDEDALKPEYSDLDLTIQPGWGFIKDQQYTRLDSEYTYDYTTHLPSTTRVDRIELDINHDIIITEGVEGSGAPSADPDRLNLGTVSLSSSAITGVSDERKTY